MEIGKDSWEGLSKVYEEQGLFLIRPKSAERLRKCWGEFLAPSVFLLKKPSIIYAN